MLQVGLDWLIVLWLVILLIFGIGCLIIVAWMQIWLVCRLVCCLLGYSVCWCVVLFGCVCLWPGCGGFWICSFGCAFWLVLLLFGVMWLGLVIIGFVVNSVVCCYWVIVYFNFVCLGLVVVIVCRYFDLAAWWLVWL